MARVHRAEMKRTRVLYRQLEGLQAPADEIGSRKTSAPSNSFSDTRHRSPCRAALARANAASASRGCKSFCGLLVAPSRSASPT
jgi:hypothetical protein